jgi:hypothetical protein
MGTFSFPPPEMSPGIAISQLSALHANGKMAEVTTMAVESRAQRWKENECS